MNISANKNNELNNKIACIVIISAIGMITLSGCNNTGHDISFEITTQTNVEKTAIFETTTH